MAPPRPRCCSRESSRWSSEATSRPVREHVPCGRGTARGHDLGYRTGQAGRAALALEVGARPRAQAHRSQGGAASASARPPGPPAPSPRREVACPAPWCSSRPGRWCASWRLGCSRRRGPPGASTWPPTPADSMRPSPTRRGWRPPCWRPRLSGGRLASPFTARAGVPPGVDRSDGALGLVQGALECLQGLDSPGGAQGPGRRTAQRAVPPQPAARRGRSRTPEPAAPQVTDQIAKTRFCRFGGYPAGELSAWTRQAAARLAVPRDYPRQAHEDAPRACSVGGPSEDRREYRKDSSLVMRSSSQNRQARTADGRCQEPGGARVRVEADHPIHFYHSGPISLWPPPRVDAPCCGLALLRGSLGYRRCTSPSAVEAEGFLGFGPEWSHTGEAWVRARRRLVRVVAFG